MVHPLSHRISRARRYSGYRSPTLSFTYRTLTFSGQPSHAVQLEVIVLNAVLTPEGLLLPVQPFPLSLATTQGISVDFFSSSYLDVSVQTVPLIQLLIHCMMHKLDSMRISPFGYLRINSCLPIPAAFRSLPRPSSAPDAKASFLRSYQLNLSFQNYGLIAWSHLSMFSNRRIFLKFPFLNWLMFHLNQVR